MSIVTNYTTSNNWELGLNLDPLNKVPFKRATRRVPFPDISLILPVIPIVSMQFLFLV